MSKILKIYKFIRDTFSKDGYYKLEENEAKLTKKITFRITENEQELIERYCIFRDIKISKFIRIAVNNEITRFINQHNGAEKYRNSKVS